jgi:hypothetical protein
MSKPWQALVSVMTHRIQEIGACLAETVNESSNSFARTALVRLPILASRFARNRLRIPIESP